MSRTKQGQKKHDESVRRSANWYKNNGYSVQADLPGEKKPKKINGHIPDLIAKKGQKEIIAEFETRQTVNTDEGQHQAFRKYANQKKGREFRKKIAK